MENEKAMENRAYDPEDREIDLVDLMFYLLRKWNIILIAGIVCAILAGGYCYVDKLQDLNEENLEEQEAYEKELSKYERKQQNYEDKLKIADNNLEEMQNILRKKQEYLQNSIYLNLDPTKVAKSMCSWLIKLNDNEWANYHEGMEDPVDQIVKYYAVDALNTLIDWDSVAKIVGESPEYMKELVVLSPDTDANKVNLTVSYKDEAGAEKIREELKKQLTEGWKKNSGVLPGHSVNPVLENTFTIADNSVVSTRKTAVDEITSYTKEMRAAIISTEDADKYLKTLEEPEKPKAHTSKKKEMLKYAVIGLLAGMFLVTAVLGAFYILSGVLHTGDELTSYYGIELFADISGNSAGKKNFAESIINKISGKKALPEEEYLKRTALRITALSKNPEVYVTGTLPAEDLKKYTEKLGSLLKDKELKQIDNVVVSSDNLSGIRKDTDILIIEKKNKSKHGDIETEASLIKKQGGRILGAIAI